MSAGLLGALSAGLVLAAPAVADESPSVTHIPTAAGTAQVGQEMRARDATWTGDEPMDVSWTWARCTSDDDIEDCAAIDGADEITYRPTAADVGRRLRVLLVLSNRSGYAWAVSTATSAVTSLPAPGPSPDPTPVPTPGPSPTPGPDGSPSPPGPVVTPLIPRLMKPFPVIRVRGEVTPGGAKVTLLTVKAPRGAAITLRCWGRSCPVSKWAKTAGVTRIYKFQRRLAAGTKIVITITRPNRIGKHTTLVIRRGKAPLRRDRCLYPGDEKPTKCVPT